MKEPLSNAPSRSSLGSDRGELPEPDPFNESEFRAWRGFRRIRTTVDAELARRLDEAHGLSILEYGVLIALVTAPERSLRMTELAHHVLTSPSGMTRAVVRLRDDGLVTREPDPTDGRAVNVTLTRDGLRRLREAQVTHHACVRELLFGGLTTSDLKRLAAIYDKAMPGILDEPIWPPVAGSRSA
jgi:DNA-binding MarR family transcriptional regulator